MQIMTRDQVVLAINAGLELLSPDSEINIPAKHLEGAFLLKLLLAGMSRGEVAVAPAELPNTLTEEGEE